MPWSSLRPSNYQPGRFPGNHQRSGNDRADVRKSSTPITRRITERFPRLSMGMCSSFLRERVSGRQLPTTHSLRHSSPPRTSPYRSATLHEKGKMAPDKHHLYWITNPEGKDYCYIRCARKLAWSPRAATAPIRGPAIDRQKAFLIVRYAHGAVSNREPQSDRAGPPAITMDEVLRTAAALDPAGRPDPDDHGPGRLTNI